MSEKLYAVLMRGTSPNCARTVAVVDNQEIVTRFAREVAADMNVGGAERVRHRIGRCRADADEAPEEGDGHG